MKMSKLKDFLETDKIGWMSIESAAELYIEAKEITDSKHQKIAIKAFIDGFECGLKAKESNTKQ